MDDRPAPIPLPDVNNIRLHAEAERLADVHATDYGTQVIRLAKILAVQDSANEVQSGHIEAARALIRREPERSRSTELALVVGGALFGAFVQGFIDALGDGKPLLIVTYVILGFLGLGIVVWAILRRRFS